MDVVVGGFLHRSHDPSIVGNLDEFAVCLVNANIRDGH